MTFLNPVMLAGLAVRLLGVSLRFRRCGSAQQMAAGGQFLASVTIGQIAVVTNSHEAVG